MYLLRFAGFLSLLISFCLHAAGWESLYSDLDLKKCKILQVDKETGSSESLCPGIADYKLIVSDDDLRQSVTVVDPKGKQHSLNFYSTISSGFSLLGPKAEWRVKDFLSRSGQDHAGLDLRHAKDSARSRHE